MIVKNRTSDGGELKKDLSNYNENAYKRPSVTADVAICTIKDDELKVLLIKRGKEPFKDHWAIPGGFLDVDEDEELITAARRELVEETHVENVFMEQLKTYGKKGRDPRTRVITVCYYALVPYDEISKQKIKADDDAKDVDWFTLSDLPKNIAFDHAKILSDLLERLRGKISYSSIAFSLVAEKFTRSEIQKVYETILGKTFLDSNFMRSLESVYEIRRLGEFKKIKTQGRRQEYLEIIRQKKIF